LLTDACVAVETEQSVANALFFSPHFRRTQALRYICDMSPEEFIAHWSPGGGGYGMKERAGAQPHFIDLCNVLGVEAPHDAENYTFEKGTLKLGEKRGFADVFKRGCFAWEYKAPGGDLTGALRQLKDYANALDNPPLLIVSDRLAFEIHTQFTGRPTETLRFALKDFGKPENREILRRAFTAPESFQPKRTNRDITEQAAKAFAEVAERMRNERREPPERVAHFLTQCLFCFFAEDVGLLPERLFEKLVAKQITPEKLRGAMIELFEKMQRGGLFGTEDIPWFNGGLFQKIDVPMITPMDVSALKTASQLNWSAIDVAIFGTLFERGLDPKKRSQLGAHYTDPETIMRIVAPVVERPLRAEWACVRDEIAAQMAKSKKRNDAAFKKAQARFTQFLERLAVYRVLDPACGSGNFLYLALKTIKDIEHGVQVDAQSLGLDRPIDLVTSPANVLGIEINEYAAELARVTVWIGELQWRLTHGYPFKQNPVLEPLDHIEHRDALLSTSPLGRGRDEGAGEGNAGALKPSLALSGTLSQGERRTHREAEWPRADAVIGNPPFIGQRFQRRELGDDYVAALRKVYGSRCTGNADFVMYWLIRAVATMDAGRTHVAGLVTTNSVRGGDNRAVVESFVDRFRIFEAWSDQPWVNDGADVRVSIVCFGHSDQPATLDGKPVDSINTDLTAVDSLAGAHDLTKAQSLAESSDCAYAGFQMNGSFDVAYETARGWILSPNPHGKSSSIVLRPYANTNDLTKRSRERWVIDFSGFTESEAALFEGPFAHVRAHVLPEREKKREQRLIDNYWLHKRSSPALRAAVAPLDRFLVTPMVSKHRLFCWLPTIRLPENAAIAIARSDDATFGVLHSRFHEMWSLRLGTSLEDRPRYTPTTCFETFPFPEGLTPRDTAHQRTETLEDGAVIPLFFPSPRVGEGARRAGEGVDATQTDLQAKHHPLPSRERGNIRGTADASLRDAAIAIARAAKRLNDLRENWLNPKEWTERVPEVIPLGMSESPYPDRILPKANLDARDLAELKKRTLTNLYNQRPAWLNDAHAALDAAVANAYGWSDYTSAMSDNEILSRLLALNRARAEGEGSAS
jgi:SAM-dependent methyltransferase